MGVVGGRKFKAGLPVRTLGSGDEGYPRGLRDLDELEPLRIVALTGFGQPAYIAATATGGFDLHLTKPATAQELMDALG